MPAVKPNCLILYVIVSPCSKATLLETKQRLKELTDKTDWKKTNNMRYWGSPEGKTVPQLKKEINDLKSAK